MAKKGATSFRNMLTDRFATEWKLLSETEAYVSHTPDFQSYEPQFKEWRRRLQQRNTGDTELVSIRSEIVTLRKELRMKGYDLTLGLQRLVVHGFRNDDSMAEGFARVVVCFCGDETYFHTGTGNHVALAAELTDTLQKRRSLKAPETHYLWYLRCAQGLYLSGSATEREEDFIRLENRAKANPMKLLSSLKELA